MVCKKGDHSDSGGFCCRNCHLHRIKLGACSSDCLSGNVSVVACLRTQTCYELHKHLPVCGEMPFENDLIHSDTDSCTKLANTQP